MHRDWEDSFFIKFENVIYLEILTLLHWKRKETLRQTSYYFEVWGLWSTLIALFATKGGSKFFSQDYPLPTSKGSLSDYNMHVPRSPPSLICSSLLDQLLTFLVLTWILHISRSNQSTLIMHSAHVPSPRPPQDENLMISKVCLIVT